MRNAECGIAVAGRSPSDARCDIPHSAFPISHWAGRGGAVKSAVVFDTLPPGWEGARYQKEGEGKGRGAEYARGPGLVALGHNRLLGGGGEPPGPGPGAHGCLLP